MGKPKRDTTTTPYAEVALAGYLNNPRRYDNVHFSVQYATRTATIWAFDRQLGTVELHCYPLSPEFCAELDKWEDLS